MGQFKEFIEEQKLSIHDHAVSKKFIFELQQELSIIASSNLNEAKKSNFKIDPALGRLVATKVRGLIKQQKSLWKAVQLERDPAKKTDLLGKMQLTATKLQALDLSFMLGDRTLINI